MIKVCHVTCVHTSTDVRIFYKECSSLAKAGYDVYLIAPGASREENEVHVRGVGNKPNSRIRRITAFAQKVYKAALSVDAEIYHLHDPELLPYAVKLKRRGKKVIFDSHENTLNQVKDKAWIPRQIRGIISCLYRLYASRSFARLDALISVTPDIVNELKKLNRQTWLVTNYPILQTYSHNAPEQFSLCFTGGINRQWNHNIVIRAIENMDNVTYRICGVPDNTYLSYLQTLKGWDKVDYMGYVSHEKALNVQTSSSVGMVILAPSSNTLYSNGSLGNTKIFEYMMSGLPVICTNFSLWESIVNKYHCGICVDSSNVDAVLAAIIYIKQHADEAIEMGRNGRRAVEEEFNWTTQEIKLLELYKNLSALI